MAGFDRSRFGGSKIASIKKANEGAKKNDKFFGNNDSGYVPFFKIEEGDNWMRVACTHDINDPTPYGIVKTSFLSVEVDKWVEGEVAGKEIKRRPVFIATQHSPKDEKGDSIIKKDPIETYIQFVYKKADEEFGSDEEKNEFLDPVKGGFKSKHDGIMPSTNREPYIFTKDGELKRVSLSYTRWKQVEEESLKQSDGDIMSLDVFSDPDKGLPMVITKTITDKPGKGGKTFKETKYSVSAELIKPGQDWDTFYEKNRLTDEQLQKLLKAKSLKEKFIGNYNQHDFDLALDGLKRFDDEHGYGIFANNEFLDVLEEIGAVVPEDPKKEESDTKEGKDIEKTFSKPTETAATETKSTDGSALTPKRMKDFLNGYIDDEYGEGYSLPSLTPAKLKVWYQLAVDGAVLPFPEDKEPIQEAEVIEESKTEDAPELNKSDADLDVDNSASADLRKKLAGMKNRKKTE